MTRQRISVSYRTAIIAVALWCLPFRDCRATETSFERDVRPILKAHCWHCHGEEPELKGGLDARLVRSILKGGDSGAAVVAGDHSASLIYQRIASGEMPPGEKKISSDELRMLAEWIDAGAKRFAPNLNRFLLATSLRKRIGNTGHSSRSMPLQFQLSNIRNSSDHRSTHSFLRNWRKGTQF